MKKYVCLVCLFAMLLFVSNAGATTSFGGYNFADNAFADTLPASYGSFSTSGGSVAQVLTDINPGTYAFSWTTGAYVKLGFTDNWLVNGAGPDLVLFETGTPDWFKVQFNSTTINYQSAYNGYHYGGWNSNSVAIDLSDFGIALGAKLNSVWIGLDYAIGTVPSLSLAAALNSAPIGQVPEPTTLLLLGLGIIGLAGLRKKMK